MQSLALRDAFNRIHTVERRLSLARIVEARLGVVDDYHRQYGGPDLTGWENIMQLMTPIGYRPLTTASTLGSSMSRLFFIVIDRFRVAHHGGALMCARRDIHLVASDMTQEMLESSRRSVWERVSLPGSQTQILTTA